MLQLTLYPDPVLRRRAAPVDEVTDDIRSLAQRMIEVMVESDGIGLAAPQVGIGLRIFVCHVPTDDAEPSDQSSGMSAAGPMVCINPEIVDPGDERSAFEEGCLSLPGLRGDVVRPEVVTLRALDIDGEPFEARADGLLARCWQHELDHLDGILIIDRMSQMGRLKVRRRLRELERGL
ncbi:MAG: peptide deformylase [Planctomycetota bacterium]